MEIAEFPSIQSQCQEDVSYSILRTLRVFLDTTWMEGNVGHLNPNWVKAVVIDNGQEQFCFVTMDAIGADGNVGQKAYLMVSGSYLEAGH